MTSIGETLRRERVRRNLGLGQIASETKISAKLLEAIEAEEFDKLPGGVFARSFVRQYAQVLGLDAAELVSELDRKLEPAAPLFHSGSSRGDASAAEIHLPKVEEWQQAGEGRFQFSSTLPALAMVVLVMLVCSGVYAWWQRRPAPPARPSPEYTPAVTQAQPPVPQPQQQQAQPPVTAPAPAQEAQPQAPAPAAPAAASPARDTVSAGTVPANAEPASPPPVAAVEKPRAQTAAPPNPNATVRLQLTAQEATWVLVRTDGKYLFSGTLQANETRAVEATGTVLVRLGNAGGVDITLNGKPLGVAGPKGQVRTLQFGTGGFQVVPPVVAVPKPKPPPFLDPL